MSLLALALSISYGLVAIGCITLDQAWRSISYRLVLTIACSFGPGAALTRGDLQNALDNKWREANGAQQVKAG